MMNSEAPIVIWCIYFLCLFNPIREFKNKSKDCKQGRTGSLSKFPTTIDPETWINVAAIFIVESTCAIIMNEMVIVIIHLV